mmetsp:Transcript_14018/g.25301  ORF Transcript_14018/g.25301 Transcript_14018/m.25301 type:complete len:345 (-) Transcript_14018:1061-2095(-)
MVEDDVRALFGVSFPVVVLLSMLSLPLPPLLSLACWFSNPRLFEMPQQDSEDLRLLGEMQADDCVSNDSPRTSRAIRRISLSLAATEESAAAEGVLPLPNVEKLSEILAEEGEVYSSGSMVTENGSRLPAFPSPLLLLWLSPSISMLSSSTLPHSSIKLFRSREKSELSLRLFLGRELPALLRPDLYGVCFLPRFFGGLFPSFKRPSSSSSSSPMMESKSSSHCANKATFLAVSLDTPCSSTSFSVSLISEGKMRCTTAEGMGVISVMGWRKSNSAALLWPNLTADWVRARVGGRRVMLFFGVVPSSLVSSFSLVSSVGVDRWGVSSSMVGMFVFLSEVVTIGE